MFFFSLCYSILIFLPSFFLKKLRINENIRAKEVRLVTEDSQDVLPLDEALAMAKEQELDLIEVSPDASPPVVKILDRGSYLYQLKKKEKKQKAHNKQTEVKMVRFGFRTEKHDLDRLGKQTLDFLADRHLVKVVVRLRGREFTNQEYAKNKLKQFVIDLGEEAEVQQEMKKQGNQYIVIVRGKK